MRDNSRSLWTDVTSGPENKQVAQLCQAWVSWAPWLHFWPLPTNFLPTSLLTAWQIVKMGMVYIETFLPNYCLSSTLILHSYTGCSKRKHMTGVYTKYVARADTAVQQEDWTHDLTSHVYWFSMIMKDNHKGINLEIIHVWKCYSNGPTYT